MVDWTLDYNEQIDDRFDFEYLDPTKLHINKRGDTLTLTLRGDRSYLKAYAVRAFPLTAPNSYICLIDAIAGHEIGVLHNLGDLQPRDRHLVQDDLKRRYFIPKVIRIRKANKEFGAVYWDVDTDRGRREFTMRGIRDSIHEIQPGRYLLVDVDGNRFEIPQLTNLDARSRACWEKIV